MGQALYRKYRSKSLDEVLGQEHVTTTLKNALTNGRISHAYLLTGPRGVGKTSIARILAHEINGLPYTDETHLDIIEIDAASNRRIDEIRDLRDRVSTAPASAKYKVYIIDEVHMLTREAFNALLKTLEEPPAHVVFILATTEAHKLPETIISRTQRFTFRPAAPDKVIALLKQIAKTEKITIDDDALTLIAEHGDGSFRDSVSLLDQASSTAEHVTRADIERILGLAPAEQVTALRTAVANHQTEAIVTVLTQLYSDGYEPAAIATQLSAVLRHAVLQGGTDATDLLNLLQQLLEVPGARSPRQLLELILLRAGLTGAATPLPAVAPTIQATTFSPAAPEPKATPPKAKTEPKIESSRPPAEVAATTPTDSLTTPAASEPVPVAAPAASAITTADITELWQQALEEIKKQYNTLYGIARMAKPVLTDGTLTLAFKFPFHQKRVNEPKNRQIFAELMERLYGSPLEILCVVAEESDSITAPTPDVAAISNIFGGAELLES